ncbi:MAG: hypothetical protein KGD64_05620 [Candidatus Heimdallarchaeota archaeon]|nr:hypothetical protein [Candidatus Heimdallarchaeota archaeon]
MSDKISNSAENNNVHKKVEQQVIEVIQVQWERHEEIRELLFILKEKILLDLNSLGFVGRVEVQGSFVRKTYLGEDEVYDLLLILPQTEKAKVHQILDSLAKRLRKDRIKKSLLEVKKRTGKIPHLRITAEDEQVNLFVCFEVTPGESQISIFDYVPMHSQYVLTHMQENERIEVLLLKKFMKTIRVYRNEIGAVGFNGYLCELLILFYGSFWETIKGISSWRPRTVIDVKRKKEQIEDVDSLTSEMLLRYYPLYVHDPLNPKDNVAADVSILQFMSLIAAANTYKFNPTIHFFEDLQCEIPLFDDLVRKIISTGRETLVLMLKRNYQESEICWQKALSIKSAFESEIFANNYILERAQTFVSDDYYGLMVSLMNADPQHLIRKDGPSITSKESLEFLKRYTKHVDVVAGPFIDNERWAIYLTKKGQKIFDFLENLVKRNTFVLNVDSFLKIEIKEKMKVLGIDEKLREIYDFDTTLAESLYTFIERKPLWICNLTDTHNE